jgi:hypothetical protein
VLGRSLFSASFAFVLIMAAEPGAGLVASLGHAPALCLTAPRARGQATHSVRAVQSQHMLRPSQPRSLAIRGNKRKRTDCR